MSTTTSFRKLSAVLLMLSILISGIICNPQLVFASDDERQNDTFEGLTPDECVSVLKQYGLQLSSYYTAYPQEAEAAVSLIINDIRNGMLEPDYYYNFSELKALAEDIIAINESKNLIPVGDALTRYTLQNSTQYGTWKNSYTTYNCYAYAIRRSSAGDIEPGDYSSVPSSNTIAAYANAVVADLQALGYTAYKTTVKPTSLSSGQYAICIRKNIDFHLMRSTDGSNWYHKPAHTNPLKWNWSNPNYRTWNNEHSINNISYTYTTTYTSTIYYIIYS